MTRHHRTCFAQFLASIVLATGPVAALAEDDFEGTYVNGNTRIEWRAGGRLGNEFVSSLCPDKKFHPRTHASHSHAGKDYTIKSDFQFNELKVTGASKCLPKGTYTRVR
ncbi:hypothetical protein [Variovorax sp. GT1P44]|uniref:hypothetical protein n=1 Tax=Variovorax sp. GT1P44 TaxID=3443742 RepID=UPI003F447C61